MRWSSMTVVAALLLAGCGSDASGGEEVQVAPPAKGLGSIYGVVVDETITPIANVTVSTRDGGLQTTTDETGGFLFEDVEPGSYFLEASGPGIQAVQTSVEVRSDEVAQVKIQVALVALDDPYHRTNQFIARHATSIPFLTVYYSSPRTDIDGPFETVVYEADWSDSTMVLYPMDPTPYYHRLRSGDWDRAGRTGPVSTTVYNGTGYSPGADGADSLVLTAYPYSQLGVSMDAKAEIFITIFYNDAAPEGWSIIDGTGTPG